MINIENIDDNECFKWCLVRYLDRVDHNPKGIKKAKELDFKDDFSNQSYRHSKIEKKKKKKKIPSALVFLAMKIRKHLIYISKNFVKINMLIYY